MGLADGLEKVFNPIARILRNPWIKIVFGTVIGGYALLLAVQYYGGRRLYDLIYSDLLKTGAFTNQYFLKAAALALTMVSLAFVPTILGLWLRLKSKIASLITGGVFTAWLVLLGALAAWHHPIFDTEDGTAQCNYFLNEDGKVVLRPIVFKVDPDTGTALRGIDSPIMSKWRAENPGASPTCKWPVEAAPLLPPPPPPRTPQPMTISDPDKWPWFIHGGAAVWYMRDRDGSYRYFDGPGKDPVTGEELTAVTRDVVDAARRLQAQRVRQLAIEAAKAGKEESVRHAGDALAKGNYDLVLTDCPSGEGDAQDDPCVALHQQAAHGKATALAMQSQQEVQRYELDEAVRSAQQALKLEPDNQPAKDILRVARALQRADAGPRR